DEIERLLATDHYRFHSFGAQEIRRVLSPVSGGKNPIALALVKPDDFIVLDLAKQQIDQPRIFFQSEESGSRRMTQIGIDEKNLVPRVGGQRGKRQRDGRL